MKFSSGYSNALDIENCGDSRLFIVEQEGKIFICDSSGTRNPTPFLDITDSVTFPVNKVCLALHLILLMQPTVTFYVNYINKAGNTQISRFRVNPLILTVANAASEKFILK